MKPTLLFCSLVGLSLLLAACGAKPTLPAQPTPVPPTAAETLAPGTPSVTPSATQDLCTQANLPESVKIVNTYVKLFTQYTSLSYQTPKGALPVLISSMKSIRDALQAQSVPPCLIALKQYALLYMNSAIQTETTFASQPTPDAAAFAAGSAQARKYNDQYAVELARLLGVTLGAPTETPAAAQLTDTPTVTTVVNPGPNPLNLHVSPSLTSESIGLLNANQIATALARSSDGDWVQIEVPSQAGTKAWVYASLVQYTSGDPNALPVVTP
jgi:hypothetical protein